MLIVSRETMVREMAMTDQLQGSPVLAEVLGDALPKLERFHAKMPEEGEPRGLTGPRDVDIIWDG